MLTAFLTHEFDRCYGIEILKGLHDAGVEAFKVRALQVIAIIACSSARDDQRFDKEFRPKLDENRKTELKLIHGRWARTRIAGSRFVRMMMPCSFLELDWSDASVVFGEYC